MINRVLKTLLETDGQLTRRLLGGTQGKYSVKVLDKVSKQLSSSVDGANEYILIHREECLL